LYVVTNPNLPSLISERAPGRIGALITIAVHVLALAVVLSYQPARSALLAAAPIMVDWIVQPNVQRPKELPKPKPVAKPAPQPVEPAPIIAAANETPAPAEAPAPPPPAATAITAVLEPVLTLPIFNADYLDNPAPPYPALSRRMGEQGRVMLRVLVKPDGRADQIQIQSSSGFVRLDGVARETVLRWKFIPAKRGVEAVPAWVLIPISFRLEG
jgi:protein TonB